ncbi:C39 family peptidase [Actinoallomurus sp. CA-142502]|uniref:C39 family peptidase n=1 Tax=Actinoallomurus sp. CA-142502 TaxID=3239885 RepID=UPI003D8C155A
MGRKRFRNGTSLSGIYSPVMPGRKVKMVSIRTLVGVALAVALVAGGAAVAATQRGRAPRNSHAATISSPPPGAGGSSSVATSPSPTPVDAYRLKLKGQYQQTSYYCEPASAAMSLATFGVKVDQNTLARKMKTRSTGTKISDVETVMDSYLYKRHYNDTVVGDVFDAPEILMTKVSYDVGILRRAPILQVWSKRLPWDRRAGKGEEHAIVAYGYQISKGTITVFDPWGPTGGTHTISAKALATSFADRAAMHYFERL